MYSLGVAIVQVAMSEAGNYLHVGNLVQLLSTHSALASFPSSTVEPDNEAIISELQTTVCYNN